MKKYLIELTDFQKMGKKEKVLYLLLGILSVVLGVILIVTRLHEGSGSGGVLFPSIMVLSGINVILYCTEVFFRFFRRYILVDQLGVHYSLAFYSPSRRLLWKDIKRIEIRLLRILITQKSGKTHKINLGEVPYHDVRNLKELIMAVARGKRISCRDLTEKDFQRQ